MKETYSYSAGIEIKYRCGVLVVGGGPAGVMAAVSAAREGADVILAERFGRVGGMMTVGNVGPLLGETCRGTLADEFIARMRKLDGDPELHRTRNGLEQPVDREVAGRVLTEMLKEAGVRLLLTAAFADVMKDGAGRVSGCIFTSQQGLFGVGADITVDCTGDGAVAAAAGAAYGLGIEEIGTGGSYEPGEDNIGSLQPMTLEFTLCGVDDSVAISVWGGTDPVVIPSGEFAGMQYRELCKMKNREGELPENISIVRLHRTGRPGEMNVNATQANGFDPFDPGSLGEAEALLSEQIGICVDFLRKYIPGYENCRVKSSADTVGIRESRRIAGIGRVTDADLEEGRHRDDAVVHDAWFLIDIHNPKGAGQAEGHAHDAKAYDIPYGALVPAGVRGMLLGGRCISGTHRAHASYRVMIICMATGEAAGIAAAIASATGSEPADIRPADVRAILTSRGVEL